MASGWCCAQAILWLWARHRCCDPLAVHEGGGKAKLENLEQFFRIILTTHRRTEHTWCFGLCIYCNQIQTRLCFQCIPCFPSWPCAAAFMMYWDPYFQSIIGVLFAARITGIIIQWLAQLGKLFRQFWLVRGRQYVFDSETKKKTPRWLRGGAKANWAKWMLFWEICRPDVEYVEPVDIIPWCFVHLYPANKRSGGNNFRPRSSKPFKLKTTPFDPGILQPMGSWISMRYGK